MAEDWRAAYRLAVLRYVLDNGSVRCTTAATHSYSSWGDYSREAMQMAAHLRSCGPDPAKSTDAVDSTWCEFDGTFANPPWGEHTGVDATFTCRCGHAVDVPFRLERTLGEVIQGVVNQPQEEGA